MTDFDRQILSVYGQLGRLDALNGVSLEDGRKNALARAMQFRCQRNMLDEITAEHERGFTAQRLGESRPLAA